MKFELPLVIAVAIIGRVLTELLVDDESSCYILYKDT